jgi:hypothetical protein
MCKAFWMNWGVPWKKAIPADHHGAHLGAQETIPCESPVGVQSPSCFCQAVSIPWPSQNLHHSVPWVNWTNLTVCFFPAYPSHHKRPITPSSFFIPECQSSSGPISCLSWLHLMGPETLDQSPTLYLNLNIILTWLKPGLPSPQLSDSHPALSSSGCFVSNSCYETGLRLEWVYPLASHYHF